MRSAITSAWARTTSTSWGTDERRGRIRGRDRPGDPCAARHSDEDVLRLRALVRCRAEHPHLPDLPRASGHPPGPNEQAVRLALQIALALECDIAPRSIFARKNYFYPDIPRATRSASTRNRLRSNGKLGDVRIHRVHMEEDTAKSIHVGESGRIHGSADSLVDFNRAGTPLVEIVTEPDLRDPAQARDWAALLRTTIKQLGASDVNMEEGSLRVDANVSIRKEGATELGTKTELKNMNSFRFLERGIAAELERQAAILEAGDAVDPGDAPLRSAHRGHHVTALQGVRARLPLPPRAGPRPAGADRGDDRRGPRRAAGASRRAARALPVRAGPAREAGNTARIRRRARHAYFEEVVADRRRRRRPAWSRIG